VLVPSGISKHIEVKVDEILKFIESSRFVCQFNIEGRVKRVNAQLMGDTIYCESLEFSYIGNQPNISLQFDVIWDGSKPLDNPENIHGIDAYDCPLGSIFFI
jgi:plexin A